MALASRQNGILITIGLAAVAALVAGLVLFQSGNAKGVNLTTAELVPADAGIYFALNTDLSSSQWISAFKLIERMGQDDPRSELEDAVEKLSYDWDDDVAPFLGGNAAVYVKSFDFNDFDIEGALIIQCKDGKAALDVLKDESPFDLDDDEKDGVEYWTDGSSIFVALIDDHLVLAFNEKSLFAVIDVHNGKTKSLAAVSDFQNLREETTNNFLGFIYVNAEEIANKMLDDDVLRAALNGSGTGELVFKPQAWVWGAKGDGFEFQQAFVGKGGSLSPLIAPRPSKLVKLMPGDAAVFLTATGIARTWKEITEQARDEIDDAIRSDSDYRDLDDALDEIGQELGLESVEELIALFDGETAFGMWFPSGDEDEFEFLLLAEVSGDDEAARVLRKVVQSSNSPTRSDTFSGTKVTIFEDDEQEGAYGIKAGVLYFGTIEAVRQALNGDTPPLSDVRDYKHSVAQLETGLGSFAYFDLQRLLRLAEGGIPPELDEAQRALQGFIINFVEERGVVRINAFLTIDD